MTNTMDEYPGNPAPPGDTALDDDDVMIEAEKPPKKNGFIEAEMTDITIRFEIPFLKGQHNGEDYKRHVHLLISLTNAFDNSTVRIYDNKNTRIKSFTEPKWLNQEYYAEHFTIHVDEKQRKTVIAHRVVSTKTISVMKNEPNVT